MRGLGSFQDTRLKVKPICPFCPVERNSFSWGSMYNHLWNFHKENVINILGKLKYLSGNFNTDMYRVLVYAQHNKVE